MLMRLLLVLVLALGAMPMAAPCHGVPATTTRAGAMPDCQRIAGAPAEHRRDRHGTLGEHGCIGCAALDDWLAERAPSPLAPAEIAPLAWQPRLAPLATAPPMLRPPRMA